MNNEQLSEYHEKEMQKVNVPNWIKNIKCPFCGEIIGIRGIRNIRLCFNTRNFGDLSVEILCEKCMKMDSIYYREHISSLGDFMGLLTDKSPKSEPITEEAMYKLQYNNVVENMLKESSEVITKTSFKEEKLNGNI